MGEKLRAFFTEAEKLGGMQLKLQLAGETRMTTAQAASVEDTPELIAKFERALRTVQQSRKSLAEQPLSVRSSVAGDPLKLRRHVQVYLDLMTQRGLVLGDVDETARRVNEAASEALDCARVSVWWLSPDRSKLTCADLFERGPKKHSSGVELLASDFPQYVQALGQERTIAAHDAHRDPRTACFSAPYLKPLGINSMLDVPIWVGGKMIGVTCHEHIGPARTWDEDEEKFAYLMSAFISLACERK